MFNYIFKNIFIINNIFRNIFNKTKQYYKWREIKGYFFNKIKPENLYLMKSISYDTIYQ